MLHYREREKIATLKLLHKQTSSEPTMINFINQFANKFQGSRMVEGEIIEIETLKSIASAFTNLSKATKHFAARIFTERNILKTSVDIVI